MTTAPHPDVGARAPDFTLKNQDGEDVTLSAVLAEKTAVLVFYLFDFSGG
jgi:peroxiredoxin (alkyl hydroperoxide reductase subunit C)